jgi:hypothetical protein
MTQPKPPIKPVGCAIPSRPKSAGLTGPRWAPFAMCVLLLAQYALGIAVNLFVTLPRQDHGATLVGAIERAVSNGPVALAIHACLGLALIVTALAIAVGAAISRRAGFLALALVGLAALAGAAYNGTRFVGTGENGASFGMAMAWAGAMLCYLSMLLLVGRETGLPEIDTEGRD